MNSKLLIYFLGVDKMPIKQTDPRKRYNRMSDEAFRLRNIMDRIQIKDSKNGTKTDVSDLRAEYDKLMAEKEELYHQIAQDEYNRATLPTREN